MARHEDMEMIVVKEQVYTHRSVETGPWYAMLGQGRGDTWGSIRIDQERGERRKHGQQPLLSFQGKAGEAHLGLASLNKFN